MSKDIAKSIDGMLESVNGLYDDLDKFKKEIIDNVSQIFDKATAFTGNMRNTLKGMKEKADKLTDFQKNSTKSTLAAIEVLTKDLKNFIDQKMKNCIKPLFESVDENLEEGFYKGTNIVLNYNKKRKTPCTDTINRELFEKSLKKGFRIRNEELKINECAKCGNPIIGEKLQSFLKTFPIYRLKELLPNHYEKIKKDAEKCKKCGDEIKEAHRPEKTLDCDCMLCSKCIVKDNAEAINERIKRNPGDNFEFKCSGCNKVIEKSRFFMLFASPKYPLNMMKVLTMTMVTRLNNIAKNFKCCTECVESIANPEPKNSTCSHLSGCKKW